MHIVDILNRVLIFRIMHWIKRDRIVTILSLPGTDNTFFINLWEMLRSYILFGVFLNSTMSKKSIQWMRYLNDIVIIRPLLLFSFS